MKPRIHDAFGCLPVVGIVLFVGIMAYFLIGPAHALGPCGIREAIVKSLHDKFQESGRAIGVAGELAIMEVFVSKAGTWTILVTDTMGRACVIAAGSAYEELPPVKPEKSA